jgi:ABC-type polysaccharide/polyol phosphate transport system ATPase subunit/lipoprotein NlpI
MPDIAIRVCELSKRYRIGQKAHHSSPATLSGMFMEMLRRPLTNFRYLRGLSVFREHDSVHEDVIWALRDVSFEVPKGQTLGIVGNNGSGKSTLLKIMANIAYPTTGQVELYGHVSSLIGVGAGFNPELTGYENIYLNGIILGMSRAEIDHKFDDIIAFSQIEQFLYTPIKRYSQGMRARLAFSVAVHLEPDILILDEAIAAGDMGFRERCKAKLKQIAAEGRTIVMVSHILPFVADLADRCLWMADGQIVQDGSPNEVISDYLQYSKQQGSVQPDTGALVDDQIDAIYQHARQAQKQADFPQALSEFSRVLALEPQWREARLHRAQLYRKTNQWQLALTDLEQLLMLHPDDVAVLYERATLYRLQGKPEAALADYTQVLALQPDHLDALYYSGFMLRADGRFVEAKALLTQLCSLDPDHIAGWFEYGVCQRHLHELEDAVQSFSRVLMLHSDHVGAYYERGQLYRHQEVWPQALADFQRVVELQPDHSAAHYSCGLMHMKQDAIPEAIAAFTQAITLAPEHKGARYLRGLMYQRQQRWDLALSDFTCVLHLQPDHRGAYEQRALMYQRVGQLDAAIADYTHLMTQADAEEKTVLYLIRRGRIYREQGRLAEAIADFTRVITMQPDQIEALYERGAAYRHVEDWTKACSDLSQVLSYDPNHSAAYLHRGLVWYQQARRIHAIKRFTETVDVVPYALQMLDGLDSTDAIADEERYLRQAWDDLSQAIRYEPGLVTAHYHRGLVAIALGDESAALADLTTTLELDPDHVVAHYERARVAQRQQKLDMALSDLATVIAMRPTYAAAYLVRAQIYHELDQPDKAMADLVRAVEYNSGYLETIQHWYVRH